MTAAASVNEALDLGDIVRRTFGAIRRHPTVFLLLSLFFAGVPAVAEAVLDVETLEDGFDFDVDGFFWLMASVIAAYLLQAALIYATVADAVGRPATIGASLAGGMRNLVAVLVVALLANIGLVFGFLLLIVPGVILMLRWLVVIPVAAVEDCGFLDAFRRSAHLTKGHRWRLFGLIVAFGLLVAVTGLAVALLGQAFENAFADPVGETLSRVLAILFDIAVTLLSAAGAGAVYIELRRIKEGVGADVIARVFD